MAIVKGYKAMNSDMTCRDKKFVVGKTYTVKEVKMCSSGFHFCEKIEDVYNYYPKSSKTIIVEVEATDPLKEGDKSVTRKLKIIRKVSKTRLLDLWINKNNSGNRNSGNRNSGDWNSGNRNSGDGNSGDGNSGDWNSGSYNKSNRNNGYFNNTESNLRIFNKDSGMKWSQELENKLILLNVKPILTWVSESLMTDYEKKNNPSYKTTGGYLKKIDRMDFSQLTDSDKKVIKSLPGFDDSVFKDITGISLN